MKFRAKLYPALEASLTPEMLPALPEWYPLDPSATPDDPDPVPYSAEKRAELRRAKAVEEAVSGPYDGQLMDGNLADNEPPPAQLVPAFDNRVRYLLSRSESHGQKLVYRYDPTCPFHAPSMAAVVEAYTEAGPDYAGAAREDIRHD